ncbi:uncharacterized protein LOC118389184 isoform X3 [Oncorhynchus keta]|uniref:uncharacterized protein LOC118389184 isoform X3 n=1 Tax=Oncorhynchus keta TaxID=8018 RepID=UPI00227D4059|nr:uncharacterized protein LOC118389184 isoform X3 [Oncorhynchus keta]
MVRMRCSCMCLEVATKVANVRQLAWVPLCGRDARTNPTPLERLLCEKVKGVRFASLDYSPGPYREHYEDYPRSFDLQTFHALDVLRQSTSASQCATETAYQEEFGLQSHLNPPDNTKFTLYSHPGPMQRLETGSEEEHFTPWQSN